MLCYSYKYGSKTAPVIKSVKINNGKVGLLLLDNGGVGHLEIIDEF